MKTNGTKNTEVNVTKDEEDDEKKQDDEQYEVEEI